MQRKATFWAAAVTGKVIVRAHFSLLQINSKLKANFIKWCMFMFSSLPLFIKGDSKCLPQSEPNIRLTHMFNTCVINHRNAMSIWEVSACTRHSPQKPKITVPRRSQLLFHRRRQMPYMLSQGFGPKVLKYKCYSFCSLFEMVMVGAYQYFIFFAVCI